MAAKVLKNSVIQHIYKSFKAKIHYLYLIISFFLDFCLIYEKNKLYLSAEYRTNQIIINFTFTKL